MKLISGLLRGLDWHGEINRDAMLNGIINCSVLPKVRQTVSSLRDITLDLQKRGCSVFFENGSCYGVIERLDVLEQILSCFVYPDGEIASVYLIDTCVFLHSPDILSYFKADEMVRIPFTVLRELDHHKDNNPDLSLKKCAAYACKQIETKTLDAKKNHDDHFSVEPCDYPELLPEGFTAHKHDDLILSAALRYKLLNPRILTDDTNFRNIARTQGIDPIAWDKFVTERGGNAVRGQGGQIVGDSPIEIDSKPKLPDPEPAPASEEKPVESSAPMSIEKLYASPLHTAAKKFGLNASELSLLLSNKMKTCGDLIKADELYLHGLYKKKKAFLVNHLLEVRKKMKLEAERLSNTNIHSDD
jgi:rRNA-processing protein FCF1